MIMLNPPVVYIYALRGSNSSEVRYIGQAINPAARLISHQKKTTTKKPNKKEMWVNQVLEAGHTIEMEIIDQCCELLADEQESFWIDYYTMKGCSLVNSSVSPCRNDEFSRDRAETWLRFTGRSLQNMPASEHINFLVHLMFELDSAGIDVVKLWDHALISLLQREMYDIRLRIKGISTDDLEVFNVRK